MIAQIGRVVSRSRNARPGKPSLDARLGASCLLARQYLSRLRGEKRKVACVLTDWCGSGHPILLLFVCIIGTDFENLKAVMTKERESDHH